MIDITPYVEINDISQTDFKTLMLFRCTTLEYARKFIETGNIRFGLPKEWIKSCEKYGVGRGDLLEGAFAAIKEIDERPIDFYKSIRPNVKMTENAIEGFYYFQSIDVLNMRTFCLFGLNDNMFPNQVIAEDKRIYPSGKIPKRYFEDFAPNVTKEEYDILEPNEKPVLIVIKNPHEFFTRIRKFLYGLGLSDNEFIIQPVSYIDKHAQFLVGDVMPGELFIKDSSFDYQSEIRIVISSFKKEILQKFEVVNGIFDIGSMQDISEIQEYYFKDFIMQKRDNKLLFASSKPTKTACSKEQLMSIIGQILCNRCPEGSVRDANSTKTNLTKEEQIALIENSLKNSFHICFDRRNLTFYTDENYKPNIPDDGMRNWTLNGIEDVLSHDGCVLFERGEYIKATQNFTDAIEISSSRPDFWYNRGISYYMLEQIENSLSDYSQAIILDPNNAKYYFERAKIYEKLGLPEKVKEDYNDGIKAFNNIEDHDYSNHKEIELLFEFALATKIIENYDTSLLAISKCIELQYNIPECYNIQGNIYNSLNQISNAINSYNVYLQKNGDRHNAYMNLGVAYMRLGCDSHNIEDFLKSLDYFNIAKKILSTPLLESNIRKWYINAFIHFGLHKDNFRISVKEEFNYDPQDENISKLFEKFK